MWRPKKTTKTALLASLLGMVLMAGCIGDDESANKAPVAKVEATDDVGWTGEQFTFDAQDSYDPDGEVTKWHFDFGDGTTQDVTDEDQARVNHAYVRGGEYTVTVTVTDDGADQEGAKVDTAQTRVAVNEALPVAEQVLYATPVGNQTAEAEMPFEARDGVDRFELDLELRSLVLAGSSTLKVELLDPEGDVVDEETVSLAAGQPGTLSMEGLLTETGDHTLVFTAESGGVSATGELQVFYDADF